MNVVDMTACRYLDNASVRYLKIRISWGGALVK